MTDFIIISRPTSIFRCTNNSAQLIVHIYWKDLGSDNILFLSLRNTRKAYKNISAIPEDRQFSQCWLSQTDYTSFRHSLELIKAILPDSSRTYNTFNTDYFTETCLIKRKTQPTKTNIKLQYLSVNLSETKR